MSVTLKAYSGMETNSGEWQGAVVFAKSNLEARKKIANEFNDGELGGLKVKRAPWADEYGSRGKVPIEEMIYNGWHFECWWSGINITEEVYYDGTYIWDREKQEEVWDGSLIGKKPVGFQEGPKFACQEYADLWRESKRIEKEDNEQELKYYRGYLLSKLPEAVLMDGGGYNCDERITSHDMKTNWFDGFGPRYVHSFSIPIDFPGRKYWATFEFRQPEYGKIGPTKPVFVCASGDHEVFQAWVDKQIELRNNGQ